MKIPVFVSCPSDLNPQQEESRTLIINELKDLQLEPRARGRADYPTELPLREVLVISTHYSGGIMPGFSRFVADSGIWKKGTGKDIEKKQTEPLAFPTPWNHIEAGILFGLQLPLLIFRESNISGGIFDPGVTDIYIHKVPTLPLDKSNQDALRQVFLKWSAKVRRHYYGD